MKHSFWIVIITLVGFASCSEGEGEVENPNVSINMFGEYFFQYDTIPKVYVYRDIVNGMEEQFHRVFAINDSEGKHIVVEVYAEDGRIIEALNYNLDSLTVIDYMVVDRRQEKTKAELFKNKLIPNDKKSVASFAARFSGISDSTLFLKEIDRKYGSVKEINVMGKKVPATLFNDHLRITLFNPFTMMENEREAEAVNYFAKGYGLVEWHNTSKTIHYRLEKIISQDAFVKLISK